jgi:hypothetical protein
VGHASAYRVARVNLEGDTVGLLEVVDEALPVLRQEADSALEALRADFPSYRRTATGRLLHLVCESKPDNNRAPAPFASLSPSKPACELADFGRRSD